MNYCNEDFPRTSSLWDFGVFRNSGAWWYHFTGMQAIAFPILLSHAQCMILCTCGDTVNAYVHVVILYWHSYRQKTSLTRLVLSPTSLHADELNETKDTIEVKGEVFHKPFVEKPLSAEDHNVHIYFPSDYGGGCQRLFRKVSVPLTCARAHCTTNTIYGNDRRSSRVFNTDTLGIGAY